MKEIKSSNKLLLSLLKDHEKAEGPYKITPYWDGYNRRIFREISKHGIANLQSNYTLLKGFAEGGEPQVIAPVNDFKRFVFETLAKLPFFRKVVYEHKRLIKRYYNLHLDHKIQNAKQRLKAIEDEFGKIPFRFDLDHGDADDAFDWNGYKVTAKIVPYLERTLYFYSVIGPQKPKSILEIGPGLGLSTLCHVILNENLEHITNVDIPTTLYISSQFLKSFDEIEVKDYLDFKTNNNVLANKTDSKVSCLCIPTWAIKDISQEYEWVHNAYSFQEMEISVVKNYIDTLSKLTLKGYWIMSSIDGHVEGAGGQKDNISLSLIESLLPKGFDRVTLPASNLEEMSLKVADTLIYRKSN